MRMCVSPRERERERNSFWKSMKLKFGCEGNVKDAGDERVIDVPCSDSELI